jgi:RNA polymerase sigma factor (sigma-70 family)
MLNPFEPNDKTLWQSLRNGDNQALATLYKRHVKELHRYGRRFSLDESVVNDCLHDVFVEIWQKRAQLSPEVSNIRFYLIKSLRNRLLRTLENQKKVVLSDEMSAYNFDFEPAHDVILIQNEVEKQSYDQLNQAIDTLSARQREALFLRFHQNLSYDEIANIMAVEQQSAYNLIFRGVEALRKYFKNT